MSTTETRRFAAEVDQVLHLVTHALYSHKEIFLRELASNASDACDKLRFESIARPELLGDDPDLRIEVEYDAEARTVTIRDSGIGMSRDEVVENIGTIARSGTKRFLESLSGDARADSRLIGQFGVGFYSAFVVAERVVLRTRRAGAPEAEGVRWESTGSGEYTIADEVLPRRGTEVVLHLKPDESEFLSGWRLRSLVSKYSDHIGFPIRMRREEDGKPAADWETVNHASALWTRPKSELKDDDYQGFYKNLSHDFQDAAAWTHNRVEGNQGYTLLLYVPAKAPWDAMFSGREERRGLKLYIRRVFIMDASEQLLPAYLRFVRGVVDSDDLPLNVSREILQENRLVSQIRAACTKRTLDLLDRIAADDKDKYAGLWKEFGNVLKEGIAEDHGNRERIAKLLRFASTKGDGAAQTVSLDDYVARMAPGQEAIYFVTADSFAAAKGSPQIEALVARGVEVLLLSDRIDEWMSSYLSTYGGKPLQHVGKGEIGLDKLGPAPDAAEREAAEKAGAPLVERIKGLLGDRVSDVRASRRLTESPACLVLDRGDMAMHMQRLLKQAGHAVDAAKPVLEVNLAHPLLKRFDAEADDARAGDLALVLLEQALLAEGGQLEDPAAYVRRVNALLAA
ncbi:MAG: molecular chaperone HtpG [Xanthomonadaceae bacterium]|jgi:molecular chaperone HtpG|nr:molecular chaperone HtpG [Xanthomonadaceae bacterium]